MIVGSGVDLEEVGRVRAAIERHGERFLSRIYTPEEISYVEQTKEPLRGLCGAICRERSRHESSGNRLGRWCPLGGRRGRQRCERPAFVKAARAGGGGGSGVGLPVDPCVARPYLRYGDSAGNPRKLARITHELTVEARNRQGGPTLNVATNGDTARKNECATSWSHGTACLQKHKSELAEDRHEPTRHRFPGHFQLVWVPRSS